MSSNGTSRIWIHSLHGSYRFPLRRFRDDHGHDTDFLQLTGPLEVGGISVRLAEWCCDYANHLSFAKLHHLLTQRLHTDLSATSLHRVVQRTAHDLDREQAAAIAETQGLPLPPLAPTADLYDPDAAEVVVMEDGILAKAQKPQRKPGAHRPTRFIATNFAHLQRPDGSWQTVMESLQREGKRSFSVEEALRAAFVQAWGASAGPLAVVALSDGASAIRAHLHAVFGAAVTIVLDWFHLTKKLQQLLSGVCHGNVQRKAVQTAMEKRLWRGDVDGALAAFASIPARKPEMAEELRSYLEKHRHEIIDYERRKAAGKTIGSGRMEKVVDQAVGHRQKRKGMSWVETGSRALARLRCLELNGQWGHFWGRRAA